MRSDEALAGGGCLPKRNGGSATVEVSGPTVDGLQPRGGREVRGEVRSVGPRERALDTESAKPRGQESQDPGLLVEPPPVDDKVSRRRRQPIIVLPQVAGKVRRVGRDRFASER